ncbi:MAG: hypothetical protein PHI59_10015, partial [Candidatus Omnitrophica bacterium]|nr:hypothetical protein [Candidatus Omnitrophota bacterium]
SISYDYCFVKGFCIFKKDVNKNKVGLFFYGFDKLLHYLFTKRLSGDILASRHGNEYINTKYPDVYRLL